MALTQVPSNMLADGALIAATSQATTSGTSADITGIPSWAKRVTVMLNGVSTNGTSLPILRIGSGSIVSSGYSNAAIQLPNASGITGASSASSAGLYLWNASWSAVYDLTGHIVMTNISGNTWVMSGVIGSSQTAQAVVVSGSLTLSGALDRVRITTAGGADTLDAGSFNLFYE